MRYLLKILANFFSSPILESTYEHECNSEDTWEDKNERIAQYWHQVGEYMKTVIKNEQIKGNIPY